MRDNGDGSFYVSYTVRCAGSLSLSVELKGGGHIAGSPFYVAVDAGKMDAEKADAIGVGLEHCAVGQPAHVDLYARDSWGNALPFEREHYFAKIVCVSKAGAVAAATRRRAADAVAAEGAVSVNSPSACSVQLVPGPNGGCRLAYTLLEPGKYRLYAEVAGVPLQGSPFSLKCGAGDVDVSCCTLLEVGIGSDTLSRVSSIGGGRVWIQTRDSLANAREEGVGGVPLWVEMRESGGTVTPCTCTDLGDGRLEVAYPSNTAPGVHSLVVGRHGADGVDRDNEGMTYGQWAERLIVAKPL